MSEDYDEQPSAASLKAYEWECSLYHTKGLDQIKSVTEGWLADKFTLDLELGRTYFALPMMNAIEEGDIPQIKYLLNLGVPVDSGIGKCAIGEPAEERRVEILKLLYHHGWDVNQITPRDLPAYGYD